MTKVQAIITFCCDLYCAVDYFHFSENSTTLLTFEAGNYPIGFEKELPLTFPIVSAPQGYTFKVVLDPVTKGVTAGGMINILDKHQQVFQDVTITIIDNGELLSSIV